MADGSERSLSPLAPLARWLRVVFVRVEDHRLAAALVVAPRELLPMLRALGDPRRRDGIAASVQELLERAAAARARGRVDEGWQCVEAARRLAVFAATDEEAAAIAGAVRAEAEATLPAWRRAAILAQLRPRRVADDTAIPVDRHALYTAMRLRDEHHQHQYYRTRLVARQFKTIALYIGIALAGMLAVQRLGMPYPGSVAGPSEPAPQMLPWMALFGLLGATFSVAFPLTSGGDGRRVPEHAGGQAITLVRPLLGAAAGPVAYAFVRSGLFSSAIAGDSALLVVAFAAGFSERLILRAVGAVAGDDRASRVESALAAVAAGPPRRAPGGTARVLGADASIVVPSIVAPVVVADGAEPVSVTASTATFAALDVSRLAAAPTAETPAIRPTAGP